MAMDLEYLSDHERELDLLQPHVFNPNTGEHISVDGGRKYGVADYLDYVNMAYENPFHEMADGNHFTNEREILFHAMDLDPHEPDETVCPLPFDPLDISFEEFLETLVPKGLVVDKSGLFHHIPPQDEEDEIAPHERAEPTEDVPSIDTLTLNSAAVSPCQSVSDLSEINVDGHKQKCLWGENGLLGPKEEVPSSGARRKSGLIRAMTKKLKDQLTDMVDESNKGFKRESSSSVSHFAPGSSPASLITSLDSTLQAKLYSELEVMICNTANRFILQQYYDGRVSQYSIDKVNAAWNAKNNHHVVEFRFDQATQRELILANRRNMEFTGDSSRFPIRLQTNLHNWKKIAHEMSIRTFCLPDSAIRKHLFDLRMIIDMMNPSPETLRGFHDLGAWAHNQMLDKATADRRQSEARLKKGLRSSYSSRGSH